MIATHLLLEDIRNALKAEFKDVVFREPVENGNPFTADGEERYREPRFYIGQLPPKRGGERPDGDDQGEDVPFILVKCLAGEVSGDADSQYTVDVGIVYAVYVADDDPEAGSQDVLNMGDRIITALCRRRYWGDDHYVRAASLKMVQVTGTADTVYTSGLRIQGPYYLAAVTTQFMAHAPAQLPPQDIIGES